ncbi:glycoside hydrolase family 43 protein [Desertivirga xinjiangensis]|uniref:glycoside hydrolase family 43 protein n=1 Tax=Desertivirga xinjiangensis TaxID=539206 RepID=UPI00210DB701|nr:glycoside hydrolase family 43 protein [Pedobacter xinjiangensis]
MHSFFAWIISFGMICNIATAQILLKNPVLPGFYPDPSICKAGEDYYLVNSTFSYFPGIPVFHSKDLKNWKQIGNVIERSSQMDFMGERITRGLFAPSISFHNGTYYVACTDIDNGGNFIVTAKNPAGPWSNPVYLKEVRGIDPSLFFDGGKAYIVYNSEAPARKPLYEGHRTVRVYELDMLNLKVRGEETILVNGGADISKKPVWIEGPHLYKRKNFYYLMAAEGGTGVNHSEVIFRSKDIRGPFMPYDKNPILTQRHLDPKRKDPITSVGHADLIEGPDGSTFAVFLGARPYDGDFYNTGRETFIAPVAWLDDWPVINYGNEEVQYSYKAGWKEFPNKDINPLSGNFSTTYHFESYLDPQFLFLRTRDTSWYSFEKENGGLTIKLLPETVMGLGNPAFIGRRQQHLTSSGSVEMEFATKMENEKSGLIILQSEEHFYYLCKSFKQGKDVVQLFKSTPKSKEMELISERELGKKDAKIYLKIAASKDSYSFWYSLKRNKWTLLKEGLDARFLSTKTAGGFVGSLFGMYVTSSAKPSGNSAVYKWFSYSGSDETYQVLGSKR